MARVYEGGPLPDEALYRADFLTRLVETYDRRKAAALFRTFVASGTWHVPTFVALERVLADRRATLSTPDAAAAERVAAKTREMFGDMGSTRRRTHQESARTATFLPCLFAVVFTPTEEL
jgi:hypothetical protein